MEYLNKVCCMNCFDLLGRIESGTIDLVVTDPPYNLGRFENDNLGEKEFKEFCYKWLNECYRVVKENRLLFFTFWSDGMYEMYNVIKNTNWRFVQTVIWYYPNISGYKGKRQYLRTFDPIFVLSKALPRKLTLQKGLSSNDCWNMLKICKPQSNYKGMDRLEHPTQKPFELFERIILENSKEGEVVLDPFCGSGVTAIAAVKQGRHFVCCDIKQEFVDMANRRLNGKL